MTCCDECKGDEECANRGECICHIAQAQLEKYKKTFDDLAAY